MVGDSVEEGLDLVAVGAERLEILWAVVSTARARQDVIHLEQLWSHRPVAAGFAVVRFATSPRVTVARLASLGPVVSIPTSAN